MPTILEQHSASLPAKSDPNHVRLVVLSDTHGRHEQLPELPEGDVLMHLGDVADRGNVQHIRSFCDYIQRNSNCPEIVMIQGNHDRDRRDTHRINLAKEYTDLIYLQDECRDLADGRLRVYGSTWDASENNDYSRLLLNDDDRKVDVLLTHENPSIPLGGHGWQGSKAITRTVQQLNIPLHLFGHVHWGRGVQRLDNDSVMVNCATTWNQPVVVDWDPIARETHMVHCPRPNLVAQAGRFVVSSSSERPMMKSKRQLYQSSSF